VSWPGVMDLIRQEKVASAPPSGGWLDPGWCRFSVTAADAPNAHSLPTSPSPFCTRRHIASARTVRLVEDVGTSQTCSHLEPFVRPSKAGKSTSLLVPSAVPCTPETATILRGWERPPNHRFRTYQGSPLQRTHPSGWLHPSILSGTRPTEYPRSECLQTASPGLGHIG
jgi:hypothetical protein